MKTAAALIRVQWMIDSMLKARLLAPFGEGDDDAYRLLCLEESRLLAGPGPTSCMEELAAHASSVDETC